MERRVVAGTESDGFDSAKIESFGEGAAAQAIGFWGEAEVSAAVLLDRLDKFVIGIDGVRQAGILQFNAEDAMSLLGQQAKLLDDAVWSLSRNDADVDIDLAFTGHDIGGRAAADLSDVNGGVTENWVLAMVEGVVFQQSVEPCACLPMAVT